MILIGERFNVLVLDTNTGGLCNCIGRICSQITEYGRHYVIKNGTLFFRKKDNPAKLRLVTIKDGEPSIIKMMYKKTIPTNLSVASVEIIRGKDGNPKDVWLQ